MSDDPKPDEGHAHPHDALFRFAISNLDDARAALCGMLPPEVVALVDWSTFESIPTRVTSAELRYREPDAAFRVRLSGRVVKVALLLEHQSTVDRDMALRVAAVQSATWQAELAAGEELSVLVPIVVHHGERPWSAARSIRERLALPAGVDSTLGSLLSESQYLVYDLAAFDVDALLRSRISSPFVRVAFFVLQRARLSRSLADEMREALQDLQAIGARLDAERVFVAIFRYSVLVSKSSRRELARVLEAAMEAEMATRVLGTAAQEYFDEGVEKGIEKGIEKGEARMLLRLVERRFGRIPSEARSRIEGSSRHQLERWADRVLVASDLNDLFAEPR